MPTKTNYSIKEIENVLEHFYKLNYKITKINKECNLSVTKIKNIIKIYGPIYEKKFPQYKKNEIVTTDDFKKYLDQKESDSGETQDNSFFE